jgi:tRNA pseudouridine55 synthase
MNLVISLNKPKDITSQDAVTKVKRRLKVKKAGHCGTLDPMATGLLLVCINKATRLATYLTGFDKEYVAVMKLGETTDTQDAYGEIIDTVENVDIGEADIKAVLTSFNGRSSQLPPMHSALKHKGKPLYKYAREGIDIERKPREINVNRIELLEFDLPYVKFRVECSKGTYIRTLCANMGEKLGVGAHMTELERTAIGSFTIEDALSIEELEALDVSLPDSRGIYSMDSALTWMPELVIDEDMVKAVMHGNPINAGEGIEISDDMKAAPGIRIKAPSGDILSIGRFDEGRNMIMMDIVFTG